MNSTPLDEIVHENIIASAKKPNRWTEIDMSKYQIEVSDEFFVSMEWLYSDEATYKKKYSQKECFGQVIGMSNEKNEILSLSRYNQGKWTLNTYHYIPQLNHYYNPMIKVKIYE